MALNEIILFYSTMSPVCGTCIKFIKQNNLKINCIPLDSPEIRKKVLKGGKYFKVEYVPTLAKIHDDSKIQVFVGVDQIMKLLHTFIATEESDMDIPYEPIPQPQQQETEEVELLFEPPQQLQPSASVPSIPSVPSISQSLPQSSQQQNKPGVSSMSATIEAAERMKKERSQTLKEHGYKDQQI